MKIPAPGTPLTKQAQETQVSQLRLRGLAYGVGALGVQPGRSTESLVSATTVDYSHVRDPMQSADPPRRHRASVSSGAAACVFLGERTLAATGAAGFVALANRALIKQIR